MKKIVIFISVSLIMVSGIFVVAGNRISQSQQFHYYNAPAVRIDAVKLEVIYFVPQDQVPDVRFQEIIRNGLREVLAFHSNHFGSIQALRYVVYEKPVLGEHESLFYDGEDTLRGNHNAFRKILSETGRRIYNKNGDLYDEQFVSRHPNELPVRIFLYQGTGATSSVLGALIAYDYFTQTNYGPTTLYHELLHVFGVPDSYDYNTGINSSDDIMGSGRIKSLHETYIRYEIKKALVR